MLLVIPDPGVTPGPAWASELNTALTRVDQHDHSSSNGVKITPSGLNINTDLDINNHSLLNVETLRLLNLNTDAGTATTVYVKNGELFYEDDGANTVQLTDNGSVAGATGTIGGMDSVPPDINPTASFSTFNLDFTFNHDSARPAKFNISDIQLYPFTQDPTTPASDYVSLKSPAALSAQYDWTFPLAVPSKTSPLVWSGAGVVDDIELDNGEILIGSTAGAVAAGSITGTSNQITVTTGANTIGLSLPQDIATSSSPTFDALTTTTRFNAANGTAAAPSYRFTSDTNTGLYRVGTDALGVTTAGTLVATFDTAGVDVVGIISASNDVVAGDSFYGSLGAVSSPTYSFTGDTDTGMYSSTANEINFSTGGSTRMSIESSRLLLTEPIEGPNGSAANPAFSFSSASSTGLFYNGSQIDVSSGGTVCVRMSSGGFAVLPGGNGLIDLNNGSSTLRLTPATSVSAGALEGYINISVNGVTKRLAYYAI
jgi:hypothetical protein